MHWIEFVVGTLAGAATWAFSSLAVYGHPLRAPWTRPRAFTPYRTAGEQTAAAPKLPAYNGLRCLKCHTSGSEFIRERHAPADHRGHERMRVRCSWCGARYETRCATTTRGEPWLGEDES